MKLKDIMFLPAVWKRLVGNARITKRGTRRIIETLAERERKIDALKRVGLERHAVENIYDPPLDPYRENDDERDLQD